MRSLFGKYPRLIWSTLTLLLILGLGALQYVSVIRLMTNDATAPSSLAPVPVSMDDTDALAERLAAHALFGTPSVAPPVMEELPQTTLALQLRGVVVSTQSDQSSAMIENPDDGRVRNYFVGAALPGGVVLEEIHSDQVVLNRDGALETLMFPQAAAPQVADVSFTSSGVASATPAYSAMQQEVPDEASRQRATGRQRESEQQREARLAAQLQQRARTRTLSLEERLDRLRNNAPQQ